MTASLQNVYQLTAIFDCLHRLFDAMKHQQLKWHH